MNQLVFIGGWGRSGTTILANALASAVPNATNIGESRYLLDRGMEEGGVCGCGAFYSDCSVWGPVHNHLKHEDNSSLASLNSKFGSRAKYRQLLKLIFSLELSYSEKEWFSTMYEKLIASKSSNLVLVESSKNPVFAYPLSKAFSGKFKFIHVTRDPRGVAYSWQKKKLTGDNETATFPRYSPIRSYFEWLVVNLLCDFYKYRSRENYIKVRYEDFCEFPNKTIKQIGHFLGATLGPTDPLKVGSLHIKPQHSLSGNPSRFNTGKVAISLDNEWADKKTYTVLEKMTLLLLRPYMKKCGY